MILVQNKKITKDVFKHNDGGRVSTGFKGSAGGCVTRAIAIVTGRPYEEVYSKLAEEIKCFAGNKKVKQLKRQQEVKACQVLHRAMG